MPGHLVSMGQSVSFLCRGGRSFDLKNRRIKRKMVFQWCSLLQMHFYFACSSKYHKTSRFMVVFFAGYSINASRCMQEYIYTVPMPRTVDLYLTALYQYTKHDASFCFLSFVSILFTCSFIPTQARSLRCQYGSFSVDKIKI